MEESEGSRVSGERECEGCCEEEREGKEGTVSEQLRDKLIKLRVYTCMSVCYYQKATYENIACFKLVLSKKDPPPTPQHPAPSLQHPALIFRVQHAENVSTFRKGSGDVTVAFSFSWPRQHYSQYFCLLDHVMHSHPRCTDVLMSNKKMIVKLKWGSGDHTGAIVRKCGVIETKHMSNVKSQHS